MQEKQSLFFLDLNTENYQKHEFQEKLKQIARLKRIVIRVGCWYVYDQLKITCQKLLIIFPL